MQKSRASFTVFFEDPFWVGVYEREEPGGLTACRVVFGAEPKDGEIYEWMLQNWAQLHFGPPLADARRPRAENPKRARRMARRSLAVQGVGTKAQQALAQEHDSYLRLAAEYDNYRKRSQKEKESLYTDIRSETVEKFLPVYDNLERALAQETQDAAFKKGVEMTMNQLVSVMEKLGVVSFGAAGEVFDPQLHNAVMHVEDETLGENVIAEVFQKGFKVGEKVVRFAMVKVAN